MRLLRLILLFVLSINVSWGYAYDADINLSNHEVIGFEQQNQRYDDTPNLCYNGRHCTYTDLRKKTQQGSFFEFEVGLFAAKGLGRFYEIIGTSELEHKVFTKGLGVDELVK